MAWQSSVSVYIFAFTTDTCYYLRIAGSSPAS